MPRGRHHRKRKLSKKRTIRSSKSGSSDKASKKVELNTMSLETASVPVSSAEYRNIWQRVNWGDDDADEHTTVSESYIKAMELAEILDAPFGTSTSAKVKRLLGVIDARFEELYLAKAAARRARSRIEDINQTSLFGMLEEKHD